MLGSFIFWLQAVSQTASYSQRKGQRNLAKWHKRRNAHLEWEMNRNNEQNTYQQLHSSLISERMLWSDARPGWPASMKNQVGLEWESESHERFKQLSYMIFFQKRQRFVVQDRCSSFQTVRGQWLRWYSSGQALRTWRHQSEARSWWKAQWPGLHLPKLDALRMRMKQQLSSLNLT